MTLEVIAQIESKLQYNFKNKELLQRAFTHSSYAKIADIKDNERMEFLGDAILDMIVSEYLCARYPDCNVGVLSTMRSNIVSAKGLRPVVERLGVMRYLLVSIGALNIKAESQKIESDLYEAIVCAIYLDGGISAAQNFIINTLSQSMESISLVEQKDSKTLLQEYCQKCKLPSPKYSLIERSGTDNNPTYKYALYIGDALKSYGEGPSKKAAEQCAAKKLVTEWRI